MQSHPSTLFLYLTLCLTACLANGAETLQKAKGDTHNPIEDPEMHIIGGTDADIANYPWVGALVENVEGDNTQQFCGCTAIDPYWVITAAHCLDRDIGIDEFKVIMGTSNLEDLDSAQIYYPKSVVLHPNYAGIFDGDDDLALIQLSSPLSESIKPVNFISTPDMELPGKVARTLGWGILNIDLLNAENSATLQEVDLTIVTREFANDEIYFQGRVTEKMLSAGDFEPYKSIHAGDSGGPLVVFNPATNDWEQIGVSGYGAGCNKDTNPLSVFTRIAPQLNWINEIIQNDFLHWVGENDLSELNDSDGDDHAPLVEWMFGLDPNKEDKIDWSVNLVSDHNRSNPTIYLPLTMPNEAAKLDLKLEKSANLNEWETSDIQWQNQLVEEIADSPYSLYRVPLASKDDGPYFFRLFLDNLSGITHGPLPLRIGSEAKGFLGKAFQGNGLTPDGPTRFDYILDILDMTRQIEVTANSLNDVDFQIQIFELNKGTLIWETINSSGTASYHFSPEEAGTYLVRLESNDWNLPAAFSLYTDFFQGGDKLPESTPSLGSLTTDDTPYKRQGHFTDRHAYALGSNNTYKIELRSDNLDTILVLKDPTANQLLNEVDEESTGEGEEFLIYTDPTNNPEVVVGSWEFGQTGDYEIEIIPYTEPDEARPGDNFLGIIHQLDEKEEEDDSIFYLDFISLKEISGPAGVTINVTGMGDFIPTYLIFNVTDIGLVHAASAYCEKSSYYLKPNGTDKYKLVIIATDENVGDNYRVSITRGDQANPNEEPGFLIPNFSYRHHFAQPRLSPSIVETLYKTKLME